MPPPSQTLRRYFFSSFFFFICFFCPLLLDCWVLRRVQDASSRSRVVVTMLCVHFLCVCVRVGQAPVGTTMSAADRQAAFFAQRKREAEAQAAAKAAEAARKREELLASMNEEERQEFLASEAAREANKAKQTRVLKRQLKAYKSKKRNPLKSRGRGRGRRR